MGNYEDCDGSLRRNRFSEKIINFNKYFEGAVQSLNIKSKRHLDNSLGLPLPSRDVQVIWQTKHNTFIYAVLKAIKMTVEH